MEEEALTEEERKYLNEALSPFLKKGQVIAVVKKMYFQDRKRSFIEALIEDGSRQEVMIFPTFKTLDHYIGLMFDRRYSPDDLKLRRQA